MSDIISAHCGKVSAYGLRNYLPRCENNSWILNIVFISKRIDANLIDAYLGGHHGLEKGCEELSIELVILTSLPVNFVAKATRLIARESIRSW